MKKPFVIGVLALGLMILAHTHHVQAQARENVFEMSCLLFSHPGCHVLCHFIIQIFYHDEDTKGVCDEGNHCRCHFRVDDSLKNNFELLFDAEYVLEAIEAHTDEPRYEQIAHLFRFPLQTVGQFREALKPLLSPYQYHKLKSNDRSFAATFYKNGQVDAETVRLYVSYTLGRVFQTPVRRYFDVDYQQNLRSALESVRNEASLYNLTYEIRLMENPILEVILQDYLTDYRRQEPKFELEPEGFLIRVIRTTVVNELIEQCNKMHEDAQM